MDHDGRANDGRVNGALMMVAVVLAFHSSFPGAGTRCHNFMLTIYQALIQVRTFLEALSGCHRPENAVITPYLSIFEDIPFLDYWFRFKASGDFFEIDSDFRHRLHLNHQFSIVQQYAVKRCNSIWATFTMLNQAEI